MYRILNEIDQFRHVKKRERDLQLLIIINNVNLFDFHVLGATVAVLGGLNFFLFHEQEKEGNKKIMKEDVKL